jgi:hypothetical protein
MMASVVTTGICFSLSLGLRPSWDDSLPFLGARPVLPERVAAERPKRMCLCLGVGWIVLGL